MVHLQDMNYGHKTTLHKIADKKIFEVKVDLAGCEPHHVKENVTI